MSAPLDLHELANASGAGRAFAALKAAGFIGEDPGAPKWRVRLERTIRQTAEVEVRARSEKEAQEVARDKADRDQPDWVDDWTTEDIEALGACRVET